MTELAPEEHRVSLINRHLRVDVEPRGGRVVSLLHLAVGQQWLVPPDPDRVPGNGDPTVWAAHPRGGWDECFPSITAGRVAEFGDVRIADHGNLWGLCWTTRREFGVGDAAVVSAAEDPGRTWVFERRLSLHGARLVADYTLRSLLRRRVAYLWSMHPLFQARADLRDAFPPGTPMRVEYTTAGEVPVNSTLSWGAVVPGCHNWRLGRRGRLGTAVKGFCPARPQVTARLGRSRLRLLLDPNVTPYVGVWLNYGGWPSRHDGDHHVALEATTTPSDDLAHAVRTGTARTLPPRGAAHWSVAFEFEVVDQTAAADRRHDQADQPNPRQSYS